MYSIPELSWLMAHAHREKNDSLPARPITAGHWRAELLPRWHVLVFAIRTNVPDSTGYSFHNATGEQPPRILSSDFTAPLVPKSPAAVISAAANTLKKSWFWYSIAASLCWTAWAFTARLGSKEIPPTTMQFVSAFGFLLVGLVMVAVQRPQLKQSLRGNFYALISGVLLGLGGIALYGAYRAGDNASVVTATTSLYPGFDRTSRSHIPAGKNQ